MNRKAGRSGDRLTREDAGYDVAFDCNVNASKSSASASDKVDAFTRKVLPRMTEALCLPKPIWPAHCGPFRDHLAFSFGGCLQRIAAQRIGRLEIEPRSYGNALAHCASPCLARGFSN